MQLATLIKSISLFDTFHCTKLDIPTYEVERTSNLNPNLNVKPLQLDRHTKMFNSYRLYIKSMASLLLKNAQELTATTTPLQAAAHLREPNTSNKPREFRMFANAEPIDAIQDYSFLEPNIPPEMFLRRINSPSWEQQISGIISFEARLLGLIRRSQRINTLKSTTTTENQYTLLSVRELQSRFPYVSATGVLYKSKF